MSVQEGHRLEAIAKLTESNRRTRDPAIERQLAVLRHDAWSEVARGSPTGPWPPDGPDLFEGTIGVPELSFDDVTPERLCSGVFGHGALLVRDMFGSDVVEQLNDDIEATMSIVTSLEDGGSLDAAPEWLTPLEVDGYKDVGGLERLWVLKSGTVWAADSPRALFDIIEAMEEIGLGDLLTSIFGRRPALSVTKFAMRRVPPDTMGGWHQDGHFLGTGTRTINIWVALSRCGDQAPGLDILPRRMDRIVGTSLGPPLDFIVSQEAIDELAAETPVVRPIFEAGDALIFDQFLMHQTGWGPGLTEPRFGLECWFFDPSTYPSDLAPLVF